MKFALANAPDMFCAFGMTYSNQSVADMIALYGYSMASPRQANRNSPMPTNLPPPSAAFVFGLMFVLCNK